MHWPEQRPHACAHLLEARTQRRRVHVHAQQPRKPGHQAVLTKVGVKVDVQAVRARLPELDHTHVDVAANHLDRTGVKDGVMVLGAD
eukprot:363488-Chlamydomonas_euryale.AAC.3